MDRRKAPPPAGTVARRRGGAPVRPDAVLDAREHLADMVLDPGVVRAIGAERAAPLSLLGQQQRAGSSGGDQDGSDSGSTQGERRWLLRR